MAASPGTGRAELAPATGTVGVRFVARIIDGVIIGLPVFALQAAMGFSWASVAIGLAIDAAYEVTLVARNGQTVGKRVMRLAVVSQHTGEIPSWGSSFRRWLLPSIPALAPPGGFEVLGAAIVYVPMLFDPMRRGLHDQFAGTRVIRLADVDGG